jgi:hypothetical protein
MGNSMQTSVHRHVRIVFSRKQPIAMFSFDHWCQRPRKHFESGGALAKRGTFVYDQNQTILCRSRAERKFLKIWSLYDVGNGLYRVFTAAK